jgi:hypothetical protein
MGSFVWPSAALSQRRPMEGARNNLAGVEWEFEAALETIAEEIRDRAGGDEPLLYPIACVPVPRFPHPLRGENAQQGERNETLPAERTARLHCNIQHFRIDQRPCPLSPRRPLQDGPLAGLTARKGGCGCADDGNQQEEAGHDETAKHGAKLKRQPRVSRHAQKTKTKHGCAAGDGQRNNETD